jgi:hypothetical protein
MRENNDGINPTKTHGNMEMPQWNLLHNQYMLIKCKTNKKPQKSSLRR